MQSLVSILIPVFNSEKTLKRAVDSVLSQSYKEIEILVLDNGSTDSTPEVIRNLLSDKVRAIPTGTGKGIAAARNTLLKYAKGNYIAWLDADDLMLNNRIERQVDFMENHPEIDISGTWITTDSDELPHKKLPLNHHEISNCLWFKNCMVQPSIMSRNFYGPENIFYDETYQNSLEDYELWYRLRTLKTFANIPEFLTRYHMTTGSALVQKKLGNNFEDNLRTLWKTKWQTYELEINDEDRSRFRKFLYQNKTLSKGESNSILRVLSELNQTNKDPLFNLILALHRIRVWRNMKFILKLINLSLLKALRDYPEMKRRYLI